ncbi:MAG: sigma-70 family RNA polymerase sigma factor [Spirochaetes bacterium]|nr:sigma-70 family RNA polymerase sigma factor [Spirochaetota bacterium]
METPDGNTRERDEALIRAFQAGDPSAFKEIYGAHIGPLHHFVRRLRAGESERMESIEDSCQSIMMAVYRQLGRFAFRSSFTTYLYSAALNHVRSLRRRKPVLELDAPASRGPEGDGDSFKSLLASGREGQDETLWRRELVGLLGRAMETLPEREKEVFLLREFEGLTFEAIAEATDQTLRNVQLIKEKANLRLRRFLEAHGVQAGEGSP